MPNYGICDKTDSPDLDQLPEFSLRHLEEQEAASAKLTQAAQNAAIDTAALIRKLQNQLDEYHAQYETFKKDYCTQRAKDAKKAFHQSIISGIIGGVVGSTLGGLLVYYWPGIERAFIPLFH